MSPGPGYRPLRTVRLQVFLSAMLTISIAPAQDAISYETKTYNYSIFSKNEFNGEPGPAQQAAWSELMSRKSLTSHLFILICYR